tara:strand:- start:33 stop:257 length:225 start_codon:yes stop_codon:yes gene_type:complete
MKNTFVMGNVFAKCKHCGKMIKVTRHRLDLTIYPYCGNRHWKDGGKGGGFNCNHCKKFNKVSVLQRLYHPRFKK